MSDAGLPTPGEMRTLRAYVEYGDQASAAAALGLSTRTITMHLANLRDKLGVKRTVQAVYLLADAGLAGVQVRSA